LIYAILAMTGTSLCLSVVSVHKPCLSLYTNR